MRKIYLLFPLFILLFAGCSSDEYNDIIRDFVNYSVRFDLTSQADINLDKISIDYKDKKFEAIIDEPENRATWVRPLALRYKEAKTGDISFTFGEFAPDGYGYKNETFTINWEDGTKDVIKFDLYITWKKNNPTVRFKMSLNGVVQELDNGYWPTLHFQK